MKLNTPAVLAIIGLLIALVSFFFISSPYISIMHLIASGFVISSLILSQSRRTKQQK